MQSPKSTALAQRPGTCGFGFTALAAVFLVPHHLFQVCLWYFRLQTCAARSLVKGMRYEVDCGDLYCNSDYDAECDFSSAVLEGGVAADKSICCHRAAVAMHTKWPAAGYSTL
eukprot:17020-Heterococcus_DN1.PRE.3